MKTLIIKLRKKKLLFVAAAISILSFAFFRVGLAIWLSAVAFLLPFGYYSLNKICRKLFYSTAPSSYFQDLSKRNMDAIVAGSTVAWQAVDFTGRNYYDATGFSRSNDMVFNMLKTYFSHVKKGGTVYYVVDPVESIKIGNYISPCDYQHIHPHIFLKMGVAQDKRVMDEPLRYEAVYSLRLLCAWILKKTRKQKDWIKKSFRCKVSLDDTHSLNAYLKAVLQFCHDRDLHCRLILIERDGQVSKNLNQILMGLENSCDWKLANDVHQLNESIAEV